MEDVQTAVSMPIALAHCRKTLRRMKLKTESDQLLSIAFSTWGASFPPSAWRSL